MIDRILARYGYWRWPEKNGMAHKAALDVHMAKNRPGGDLDK